MNKITIGIIGGADIAFRRFLPALMESERFLYAGVASRSAARGSQFQEAFGGRIYDSYDALLKDEAIDAVYLPLPPALHYQWGMEALRHNKHILLEKPSTTSLPQTKQLLQCANERQLAVHENYMYAFHSQMQNFKQLIAEGTIGQVSEYMIRFGFPMRGTDDFRYNRQLGGGALLDCGGYTVNLAGELLGESCTLVGSMLRTMPGVDVDIFGSALFQNEDGVVAHTAFGMNHEYRCEAEAWGSKGILRATRIFTAGTDFAPQFELMIGGKQQRLEQKPDHQFLKSIHYFADCMEQPAIRAEAARQILKQSTMIEKIRDAAAKV